MWKTTGLAVLAIAIAVVAATLNWWPHSNPASRNLTPDLTAKLVQPDIAGDQLVFSDPLQQVEFVYQVQNNRDQAIKNIRAQLF